MSKVLRDWLTVFLSDDLVLQLKRFLPSKLNPSRSTPVTIPDLKGITHSLQEAYDSAGISFPEFQLRILTARDFLFWRLTDDRLALSAKEIAYAVRVNISEEGLGAGDLLTPHEIQWLMDQLSDIFSRSVLSILVNAGPRTGELSRLSYDQFHQDESGERYFLEIEGTRDCDRRRLTLSQERLQGLEDYCNRHGRSLTDSSSEPIFLGPTGDPIAERTLRDRLNRLGKDLDFCRSLSAQKFRNSWTFWQFLAGQSLVTIKRFLGIGKIATLERRLAPYARIRDESSGTAGESVFLPFLPSE